MPVFRCRFRKQHFLWLLVLFLVLIIVIHQIIARMKKTDFEESGAPPVSVLRRIKTITQCFDRPMVSQITQNGQFWVLNNHIKASERFKCHESVTITTQGDFTFLENLPILVERWKGPISVAVYAPGSDFKRTIDSIRYLRHCDSPLIAKFVTFHIFFDAEHVPEKNFQPEEGFDCDKKNPPYHTKTTTYKTSQNLLYPINVARNIARKMAQTHFILPLDIELFPTPDFIPKFLAMIARNQPSLIPRVFPLPVFEIESGQKLPENKTQLRELLSRKLAIPFHENICAMCHNIPDLDEWVQLNETTNLAVFRTTKRVGEYRSWEPFYVGTHSEPYFHEGLSWEGGSDKRAQGYVMCLLDYDFMVLDNAFLVHKPGIKKNTYDEGRFKYQEQTNEFLSGRFLEEMNFLYNFSENCYV